MHDCLSNVTAHMFSNGIIPRAVRDSPNYPAIIRSFETGLQMKKNLPSLRNHCSLFLQSLCDGSLGGLASKVALNLAKEWNEQSNQVLSLLFHEQEVDISRWRRLSISTPREIQISSEHQVAVDLENLYSEFQSLKHCIVLAFKDLTTKQYTEDDITSFASEHSFVTITFDDLFMESNDHPCFSFLNCDLLHVLVDHFMLHKADVQADLQAYANKLKKFETSTQLQQLKMALEKYICNGKIDSEKVTRVTIKLNKACAKMTLSHFKELLQYLFSKQADFLHLIRIEEGSIIVALQLPQSQSSSLILDLKEAKKEYFMHHLGIFEIIVDLSVLYSEEENLLFTFEHSLHEVVSAAHDMYSETLQFLLELADTEFMDENGRTALKLAVDNGHSRITIALVLAGYSTDVLDENNWSPLMVACQNNYPKIIHILLQAGADLYLKKTQWFHCISHHLFLWTL